MINSILSAFLSCFLAAFSAFLSLLDDFDPRPSCAFSCFRSIFLIFLSIFFSILSAFDGLAPAIFCSDLRCISWILRAKSSSSSELELEVSSSESADFLFLCLANPFCCFSSRFFSLLWICFALILSSIVLCSDGGGTLKVNGAM